MLALNLATLRGPLWSFNVRTGSSRLLNLARNPACPGMHRVLGTPRVVGVRAVDQVGRLFSALAEFCKEPVIRLPSPYVVEMPCAQCGCRVPSGRLAREVKDIPECGSCSPELPGVPSLPVVLTEVSPGDGLNNLRCRDLGLPPAAIFEVEDRASAELHVAQFAGSVDDIFATLTRNRRNGSKACDMDAVG